MSEILEYTDPRPGSKIGKVRIALMQLHQEHDSAGMLPTSGRFLFYELVARKTITKGSGLRPDQVVSKALMHLREQGLISWDDIVDETREVLDYTGSPTIAEDLLRYLEAARIDPWHGQAPFILTESRSLAGVLRGLCSRYHCRIASTNGQVGGFLHTKVAPLLNEGDRVGYLGDYDLSGGMIEANTRRVLECEVGELDWRRLALTREQVEQRNLPIITKRDKRFKRNGGAGGVHQAVETEALSQALIIDIVRGWLDGLLPQPFEQILESERQEREQLWRLINRARRPRI